MYRLIIEHIIYQILEEEFVALDKRSFADRESRTKTFVQKLKDGEAIDLTNGEKVVIKQVTIDGKDYTKRNFNRLLTKLPTLTSANKITFISKEGKVYNISALAKTTELGGFGKGGTLKIERAVIASLQRQLESLDTPITLNLNGKSYSGIDSIVNVKENQKADFAFTVKGKPEVYISHKGGSSASDIVFYGGISSYKSNTEVQSFIAAVKAEIQNKKGTLKFDKGDPEYTAPVGDMDLAKKVLFGSKYTEGSYSDNSVQAIVQGNKVELLPSGDSYKLTANKIILSPDVPTDSGYAPVYNARFASDRDQFGIKNCRVTVVPAASRKNTRPVSLDTVNTKPASKP